MSEKKERIAFFDTKPYDRKWFDQLNQHYHIKYYEHKLTPDSISLAQGCRAVIPFVNDTLDKTVIDGLCDAGVEMIALRCAGYNNVDRNAAAGRIAVVRVPGYSPYAVAEFTMGLLLTLNRKIHKAYFRTRDFNFSLNGLVGFDLHGRTVGVIGTGKIGQIFIRICRGFGMNVVAYDPYPLKDADFPYVSLEELLHQSDIISLHCPLTEDTRHLIGMRELKLMKRNAVLVNTSRGGIVNEHDLYIALTTGQIRAAASDVFAHEPPASDDPLIHLDNFIATFHIGGSTYESLERVSNRAVDYVFAYTGVPEQKEVIGS